MAQHSQAAFTILRRKHVEAQTGYSRSTIYLRIEQGLFPRPISLGPRAVGWLADEIGALNAARVSGLSDDEIRTLVKRLHAGRREAHAQSEEGHHVAGS